MSMVTTQCEAYMLGLFMGMTTVAGTSLTAQDYDNWVAALVR